MNIRHMLFAAVSFIALAGCQPKEAPAPEAVAPATDMSAPPMTPATTDQVPASATSETGK